MWNFYWEYTYNICIIILYEVYIYHLYIFSYIGLTYTIYLMEIVGQMYIKYASTIYKSHSKPTN